MRRTEVTGHDVRAAMFGTPVPGVRVMRQAHRVTDDDSDELAVVDGQGSWWIARRLSDRVTVWGFIDQDEADDAFDRMIGDGSWTLSRPPVVDAA